MTENEKLRSLLAEARGVLSQGCWSGECCRVRHRIDAALAEPVVPDSTAVRLQRVRDALLAAVPADGTIGNADDVSRVARLVTERDEARAEVERLRWLLMRAEGALDVVSEKWTKPAFERGEHLPMIRATLRAIRALPVPKGKP